MEWVIEAVSLELTRISSMTATTQMAVPEPTQENEKLRNYMMSSLMQHGNPVHDSRTGKLSLVSLWCSLTAVLARSDGRFTVAWVTRQSSRRICATYYQRLTDTLADLMSYGEEYSKEDSTS
ncbi:hypothetical protein EDD22DRAFT_1051147 [Suillus occidentalis]|nr:hypothetical protein EDD22DRAFT_1053955 [Suillus occidentalis]KAG1761530.1 hypothetical protein EDD22DRAFT_1051147 [Suillus occidentalis]